MPDGGWNDDGTTKQPVSYGNRLLLIKSIDFLVEISGIEPLTFPAIDAGKPPKADLIEIQEVSGVRTNPRQRKKTGMKPVFFVGGDKRDRTADLLNAILYVLSIDSLCIPSRVPSRVPSRRNRLYILAF